MDTDKDKIRIVGKDKDGKIITAEVNSRIERYAIDKTSASYYKAAKVPAWKRTVSVRGRAIKLSTLIGIIMIGILCVAAFATAFAILSWTTNVNVLANTSICFYQWSGATKANTFTYAVNIFPGVVTEDDNMTYGIYDWNNTGAAAASIQWYSCSNSSDLSSVNPLNVTVWNGSSVDSNVVFSHLWTAVPTFPDSYYAFTGLSNNTMYAMQMIINCSSSAGPGNPTSFVFNMKVTNP
jgi:hypothetical protein